jgi:hypothetical protein
VLQTTVVSYDFVGAASGEIGTGIALCAI